MSQTLTFAELVNLAIGTPELGNVNFNALHFLLHSMLQHFQLQDVEKEISEDELDFLKPPLRSPSSGAPPEPDPLVRRSNSIFHQMHERIVSIERQLHFLNDTPTTAELLARTQVGGPVKPTQDMWQLMQLKKKMELNEEGMSKAMNTLQDLLSNICALKISNENFKEELGHLKSNFQKLDIDTMQEKFQQLDEQAKALETIQQQMSHVKARSSSTPDVSDLVRWSSLCEMLLGKSYPENEREVRDQLSRERLASLGQLPEKHEVLTAQIAQLEEQLKHQAEQLGHYKTPAEDEQDLPSLLNRMSALESRDQQRKESLNSILDQMPKLREQCEKLESAVDKLKRNSVDIQNLKNMLEQLDITKADKAFIQEEMNVKADKSALDTKVNHMELSSATAQLSEMMQDLLQKMSLQDKDWQKALEKLFTDMDCKLDRMALDPLSRQLEDVWQFIKKYLSEGPRFDADSAAGFKKQLFERVKCLSCDRPVTLMTGPHLITVRKATLRPRPASANGYEYLAQKQKRAPPGGCRASLPFSLLPVGGVLSLRLSLSLGCHSVPLPASAGPSGHCAPVFTTLLMASFFRDLESDEAKGSQPPQTCWQCQAHHQACTIKRMSRSRDFATLYPYGDPNALTYDNAEVDILGVNGVLYKGRMSAQAVERTLAVQKEFLGLKPPRPPSGLRMERARSAMAEVTYVSPYAASTVRRSRSALGTHRLPPPPLALESMDRVVLGNTSHSQHSFHSKGGVTGM